MADWAITLDPVSEDAGNAELALTRPAGYRITELRCPAPTFDTLWASSIDTEGELPAGVRQGNREITVKLRMNGASDAAFRTAQRNLDMKIAKLRSEQGTLRLTYPNTDTMVFDVMAVNGGDRLFDDVQYRRHRMTEDEVSFVCLPSGRGPEQSLGNFTETTLPWLTAVVSGIKGDLNALGRILITEDSAADQMAVFVGAESRHYSAASTAALGWQAEALTPLGGASVVTGPSGASGGGSNNVVRQASLLPGWQAMLSTQATGGGAHMTHQGTFNVLARIYRPASNTGEVSLRFDWSVGDFSRSHPNAEVTFPANAYEDQWTLVKLGLVHLVPARQGTHRWEGRVAARSTVDGDDLDVDWIAFVPTGQHYGEVETTPTFDAPTTFLARDEFNQSAGALTGKVLANGGVVSGPLSPGTLADDAGVGTITWSNPSNAASSNDSRATASLTPADPQSHYLKATNFGFAVPSGATIAGIVVEIERSDVGLDQAQDNRVRIVKGGAIQSTDRAVAESWPQTDAYKSYGSPTDLWGATWAHTDINASDFGVAISAKWVSVGGPGIEARIDHVRITVYYVPSGGLVWAGSGDADDFSVETTGKTAQRTAVSDSANTGRFATVTSASYAAVAVQADIKSTLSSSSVHQAVVARYVDTSNYLLLVRAGTTLSIKKRVAGTLTTLAPITVPSWVSGESYTLRLVVDGGGRCWAWYFRTGTAAGAAILFAHDATLATGGALDDGSVGIYDENSAAAAATRNYDNWLAFSPTADAAVFAGRSLELRHNGAEREDSSGTAWTPKVVIGPYPRFAPAHREARSNRVFVKAVRGFEVQRDVWLDPAIDDLELDVFATPRYVAVPEP